MIMSLSSHACNTTTQIKWTDGRKQVPVGVAKWAWSNRWRVWQLQPPSGWEEARDNSVDGASHDASGPPAPALQPEAADPEERASWLPRN